MRQSTKTTVLPVGGGSDGSSPILVRRGEAVSYSVFAMHRRKDLYGDDADQFRPDRWEASSGKGLDLGNIGWGYLPFNGGPRVCLGRECALFLYLSLLIRFSDRGLLIRIDAHTEEFALLEASYTIVRFLQTFENIELVDEGTVDRRLLPEHTVTLVVASAKGCKVRLTASHDR